MSAKLMDIHITYPAPLKTINNSQHQTLQRLTCIYIVQQVSVHLYIHKHPYTYLNSFNRSLTFFGTAFNNIHVLAIRRYHPIIIILQQNFPLIVSKYGPSYYKA